MNSDKGKRAVIYYGGFLAKTGGAFFHAVNISRELRNSGWDVEIITLDKLPLLVRYWPHLLQKAVNVVYSPFGYLLKSRLSKILYRRFLQRDADFIIFEDIYLCWNSMIPSVTLLHAVWSDNLQAFTVSDQRQQLFREAEVQLINKIRHPLVTVSEPYRDYLLNNHFAGKLTKELTVVPLGVDQSLLADSKPGPGKGKSIITTGTLEARKNLRFLLQVFRELCQQDPDYSLTIVGDGPEREKLEQYARDNGLKVRFTGRLAYDQVHRELGQHGLYLHSSVKESFSYSLLEAKLAGLTTCANSGLEVPGEFVDIPVDGFEPGDWCREIRDYRYPSPPFDGTAYSSGRMAAATLELVFPTAPG